MRALYHVFRWNDNVYFASFAINDAITGSSLRDQVSKYITCFFYVYTALFTQTQI